MSNWNAITDSLNLAVGGVFGEADPADATRIPTYFPVIGLPFPVNGVFDDAFLAITLGDQTSEMQTTNPIMGVHLADFTAAGAALPDVDDKVYIPRVGATYVVQSSKPDSHGWAHLELMFAHPGLPVGYTP